MLVDVQCIAVKCKTLPTDLKTVTWISVPSSGTQDAPDLVLYFT